MAVKNDGRIRCSFCGKAQEQVNRLISGPNGAFICDECRKSVDNVKKAQEARIDIRTKLQKESLHISTFYNRDKIKLYASWKNTSSNNKATDNTIANKNLPKTGVASVILKANNLNYDYY